MTFIRLLLFKRKISNNFHQLPDDYEVQPGETILVSRPFDWPIMKRFYPLIFHSYFENDSENFGYQFCDWGNQNCPDNIGPALLEDNTRYLDEGYKQTKYLITTDPETSSLIKSNAIEIYDTFKYPSEGVAVLDDSCNKFIITVLKQSNLLR